MVCTQSWAGWIGGKAVKYVFVVGWRPVEQVGLEMKIGDQFPLVIWKLMVYTELTREAHNRKRNKAGHRTQGSEPV